MKRIIVILFILICSISANATHNRAGEITYKRIAPYTIVVNGATVANYTYSITVTKYTGHGGGIADRCVDTVYFGDGTRGVAPRVNGTATCSCGSVNGVSITCGEIIVNANSYTVKKNVYTIVHTFPGIGIYLMRSFDPNRNQGIRNIPNSVNLPFYIESMLIINSISANNFSSVLSYPPIDRATVGQCFYHNPCAFDEEGDSLSYEISTCRDQSGQTVQGYFYPEGSYWINALTGLLSWCTPAFQDEYQLALIVKEWRKTSCSGQYQMIGYVLRDFQVIVNSGSVSTASVSLFSDTCVSAGKLLKKNFKFISSTALACNIYGATVLSSTPAAVAIPASGTGTITSTYSWTPQCHHVRPQPHQANLVFTGSAAGAIYRNYNIYVVPPTPEIKTVQIDTSKVTIKWKSLKSCLPDLSLYKIYRKIGSNSWKHTACETGAPTSSGFIHVANKSANDNVFVDTDLWTMPNGSAGNYIVTAVTYGCLESFADSILSMPLIVGLHENSFSPLGMTIFPNPAHNSFTVQLEGNNAGRIECLIYALDGKLAGTSFFPEGRQQLTIPIVNIPKGMYIVKINTEKGSAFKKLVKD